MSALEDSYIRRIFDPELSDPVFIEGLPGFGSVGKITAQLLNEFVGAKLFAEYYSPFFPDYVIVDSDGVCTPPRYEFFAPPLGGKLSLIILTGDSQPPLDNVVAHYEICEEVLDFVQELGCKLIITVGGVPVSSEEKNVYVAATSSRLATEAKEKGGVIYERGRILGATGLFLGLAKERGLDGICLLGATGGAHKDKDAGHAVFQLLLRVLGQEAPKARRN